MKRFFTILSILLAVVVTAQAHLIFYENFNQQPGKLSLGDTPAPEGDYVGWYSYSGTKDYIQVVEGSLAHEGYATAAGNKVALSNGNAADDMRQFPPITSGKVYLAAIVNIQELKQYSATAAATTIKNGDYFLTLGDADTKYFARLYARAVKEEGADTYTHLQFGIAKYSEASTSDTDVIPMVDVDLQKDILVVLEYEFVDGEKNDIARLYINPTKEMTEPTLICMQDASTSAGTPIGANSKADATKIASVNLRQGTNTPTTTFVDEIKVATEWADLFVNGSTPMDQPELIVSANNLQFGGQVYTGMTYTATFTVTGKNLKEDITLTSSHKDVTLNPNIIMKEEAEKGVEVTATLTPTDVDMQEVEIFVTSGDTKTPAITAWWWAIAIKPCTTVAELNEQAATVTGYNTVYMHYTGEAIITYTCTEEILGDTYNLIYLQDETGAIRFRDTYWADAIQMGDKVTNFVIYAEDPTAYTIPIATQGATIEVLSHDNEVEPTLLTLSELKTQADAMLYRLIKIENITFENMTEPLTSGTTILQGENKATINLVPGNTLIGTTKPQKADIVAISNSKAGTVLRLRSEKDLIDKSTETSIHYLEDSNMIKIYTTSGLQVQELQHGVNIIRKGNKTYKVVR